MIKIHDIVESDIHRISSHTILGIHQHTCRLAGSIANKESLFFLGSDSSCKLSGNIAFQIEYRIVQELLGDLDCSTQLVCADGFDTESLVAFRIQTVLIHPCSLAMSCDNRNLTIARGCLNNRGQSSEEVFFLQRIDELSFKLVRHQISALGIGTDGQRILKLIRIALITDHIPERLAVFIRCTSGFLFRHPTALARLIHNRHGSRPCKFCVDCCLSLQTIDLFSQRDNVGFHLVIGGGIFCGKQAVVFSFAIEEVLSCFPCLCSFFSQF